MKLALSVGAVVFLVLGSLAVFTGTSQADLLDPLHGYCAGAGQCVDNGTNSPSNGNPTNFGFTISPGPATGTLMLDVLAPNNVASGPSYALTGTLTGTAALHSGTWSSGDLATFLGITASPSNPIGAFLPSTQALDAGATGFTVYSASFTSVTLKDASMPNVSPLENIAPGIPTGSYIVGFLNLGGDSSSWVATANSGAIFNSGTVPEPSTLLLLGSGLLGAVGATRKLRFW